MMTNLVAIDTETFLMGPGAVAPKLVCLSAAAFDTIHSRVSSVLYGNESSELKDMLALLQDLFADQDTTLIFHNAAFDLTVLANAFPSLIPAIFSKLEAGHITDTMIREKLLNLSTHGKLEFIVAPDGTATPIKYTLMSLVMRYMGVDRSSDKEGDDIWRLNYASLDGLRAEDYPVDADRYARQDATDTLDVYEGQAERVISEMGVGSVKTAEFHTAAAFALRLMTCWGWLIDQDKVAEVDAATQAELTPEKLSLLISSKILTPEKPEQPYANGAKAEDGTPKMKKATAPKISKKLLQAHVVKVCEKFEKDIVRTEKTQTVSTATAVISELAPLDPLLAQYQHRQKLQKLVTTYLPHLREAEYIHPDFDPLKETGRTSSYASKLYPSTNIQQEDPRTRPCFIARPGTVICSVDYESIELAALGQKCFKLFGHSVHRDKINAGVNLHTYLGAQLRFHMDQQGWDFHGDEMERYEAMVALKVDDPKVFDKWRGKMAKVTGLGKPGGMGNDTFITYAAAQGLVIDLEMAQKMNDIWLETYPEMREYFHWIKTECVDPNNVDKEGGKLYSYFSPLGMYRAGAHYCAAANGAGLQTATAEGAKAAVINVARACYDHTSESILFGCRPLAFVHDEILTQIPDDDQKHERALAISRIMIDSMQNILPDVTIRAEPALMRWWDKRAETVLDDQGRLQVWEPKTTS